MKAKKQLHPDTNLGPVLANLFCKVLGKCIYVLLKISLLREQPRARRRKDVKKKGKGYLMVVDHNLVALRQEVRVHMPPIRILKKCVEGEDFDRNGPKRLRDFLSTGQV